MDSDNIISLPKGDPDIAQMFSSCQPGEKIKVTLGYEGKTASLSITVGEDNEATFTGTVDEVSTADAGEAGKTEGEETEGVPGASATSPEEDTQDEVDASSPAAYIASKRKGKK